MVLHIYEKKEVVKTYTADVYDIMFGTLEDVAKAIKLDELKTGSDVEIIRMAGSLVVDSLDSVKDLLKDIFEGLTDEEIKHTKIREIADVLVDVVKYTIKSLDMGIDPKKVMMLGRT
jgi:hypothetical protein